MADGRALAFVPPHYLGPLELDRGWPYFMARSLAGKGFDCHVLGPFRDRLVLRVLNRIVLRRGWDPAHRVNHARSCAARIERQLERVRVDVVLSSDSIASALISDERRVVLWLDATFDNLIDFYPTATGLTKQALEDGHALEGMALERCSLAVYSSMWAAERAQSVYGLPSDRIATVSWGANLDDVRSDVEVSELISARPPQPCRLVFVGSDWGRKGGPTAVAATLALNEAGIQSELSVIGCRPRIDSAARPYVRTLGYLDKRHDDQKDAFQRELARSHFLLLPTHADCTPLAIAEAASVGVPTLASAVGGIPEMVVDRESGRLLAADSPAEAYRDAVMNLLADRPAYARLAERARAEYRARLNWQTAAEQVEALIRERVLT